MSKESAAHLLQYLEITGMTRKDLAKLFDLSTVSIWKYLKGENIHPLVAHRIEKITKGKLKASILAKK